jgi:transposase
MRVTTLFNRLLRLPGLRVTGVAFEGRGQAVLVLRIARTFKLLTCPECGTQVRGRFEEKPPRRWRHLPVLGHVTYLEGPIRRLSCPRCERVVTEGVPWARAGSTFTRPFEDAVALLAQKLSKTALAELMQISWVTVGSIAERVVEEKLDLHRLDDLRRIGIDEISYRGQRRFLTIIADHDSGRVVWAGEGKSSATVREFFDELGAERAARLELVTMDLSAAFQKAVREGAPNAEVIFDRFHLARLAHDALDAVRRADFHKLDAEAGAELKGNRWILLKRPDNLDPEEQERLAVLSKVNKRVYRAYLLKESFLDLFETKNEKRAAQALDAWIAWATRSQLPPFQRLARTVKKHRAGILRAIELPLSNARLEGTNNKIRLLSHRAYGFHTAAALISMIYLCCSGIVLPQLHII